MQTLRRHRNGDMFIFRAAPTGAPTTQIPPDTVGTRPDPLEPTTAINPHHPPIDELNVSTGQEWRWLLQQDHPSSVRAQDDAAKRRKVDDNHAIALPKPPVRSVQRRPRLPPTLSGLYQPPPNAGLLPSISIDKAVGTESGSAPVQPERSVVNREVDVEVEEPPRSGTKRKTTRNKWSENETRDLLHGVARFGIGSWTAILKCPDYHFSARTALDLKDRFRVCRPEDYGRVVKEPLLRRRCNERMSVTDLNGMGMSAPFERVERRRRHAYTDAEDDRLLKGFQRYGKQWSRIQQDQELGLHHRTRTDVRDRLRTRYPELFEQARQTNQELSTSHTISASANTSHPSDHIYPGNADQPTNSSPNSSDQRANRTSIDKPLPLPMLDPLWTFDFDDLEFSGSSITLDRDILNWPLERQNVAGSTTVGLAPTASFQPGLPSMITHDQQTDPWSHGPMLSDPSMQLPASTYHVPNLSSQNFG